MSGTKQMTSHRGFTVPHIGAGLVRAAALIGAAVLSACSVGPDFERPATQGSSAYQAQPLPEKTASSNDAGGEAQQFSVGKDISAEWWMLFHSKPLDTLIVEALKANPDLQSARAALRVGMENASAQVGAYFPTVAANFTASRNGNSVPLSPSLSSGVLLYNLYQAQLTANWTLDIWGGNRRAVEALQAQADAQRFQLESTYVALTTNVIAAAVQEASLRAQIAATNDIVKAESDSLVILQRQNALGQVAGADVAAQQAALAQAQQTLPPLQKQLAQQRDLLTALAGRLPSEQVEQTFELAALELPQDIPLSVPSKLVEQRPDVRIAEENLHAASAQVGVAIANMLPNISIAAGGGSVATGFSQLFTPGGGFWSVAGGVTQPIFEGDTLLHKTRAARAAFDQASAQYRSAVVTAFQNVADTLYALQYDAETFKAASASEHAAADSLAITRRQLELGSVSYLALLNAQQTYEQAVVNRIAAQASRLADTAVLFQALGGGWWNRSDVSESRTVAENEPQR
jgi:NodT family efflux transporter outer membrane factor (OMF) lipoprotein